MYKKRSQQRICEQAIEFFENKLFKESHKKRKIQESKEEKRDCNLIEKSPESQYFHDFKILEVKGSGAFGRIFSAQKSGNKYAIKQSKSIYKSIRNHLFFLSKKSRKYTFRSCSPK